ncbi:MAG: SirB2 family protein [Rhodocyclaceae bacterium]
MLAELYPIIKQTHIALASTSGTLFLLRGLTGLMGRTWGMRPAVRYASYAIDTGLLVSALTLLTTLGFYPLRTPWLITKLLFLVAYVVCGSLALKRARSRTGRIIAFVVAILCFAMIYTIARLHDPMGLLHLLSP